MSSKLHPDGAASASNSISNPGDNDSILSLIEARKLSRRDFLQGSVGVTTMAMLGGSVIANLGSVQAAYAHSQAPSWAGGPSPSPKGAIGFSPVAANVVPMTDGVSVPAGYAARTLVAWGDSLTKAPHWNPAGAMTEAEQLHCFGAHTDGMHFFPWRRGQGNSRGLLVTNHEYCDPPLVNAIKPASSYATAAITPDMVRAQQAAHGVGIAEVRKGKKTWTVERHSPYNRRITGNTPCKLSGPAAGHALLRTAADATGKSVLGTLNNCANGFTPWGTYLTCEENWNGYFSNETGDVAGIIDPDAKTAALRAQARYGVVKGGFGYRWHEVDERFRADLHPNEPHRFGWVVEIDPWNPEHTPVKRTALGRFKHESAAVVVGKDNTVAVYMGDDERNEYVYKFVCARKYNPRRQTANRSLLDEGTLYVAKFNADGTGTWLPLIWGQNGLTPENGFSDQGEVLIKARQAADRLGATMMDRPEWVAVHPSTHEVYLTLTNNSRRGNTPASSNKVDGTSSAASSNPPVDAANPRPDNDYGHIIRWRESGGALTALDFSWDIFVQCGDKATNPATKSLGTTYNPAGHDGYVGNIQGNDYGAPDGLWFDKDGRLWIQTDQAGDAKGDWVNIGGNVMMCADPATGETRRFLTAPPHCEVTGVISTPDGKTLFVGIQHPGEDWRDEFTENSSWPDNGHNGPTTASALGAIYKPRSAVIVITKDDGEVIGT